MFVSLYLDVLRPGGVNKTGNTSAYGQSSLLFVCPLQYRMLDPGHLVQETVTVQEEPQETMPVISVETSEDGTTRRTETTVSLFDDLNFFRDRDIWSNFTIA